jgi:hypothetical protein
MCFSFPIPQYFTVEQIRASFERHSDYHVISPNRYFLMIPSGKMLEPEQLPHAFVVIAS